MRKLPQLQRILDVLDYNPDSGIFTWKQRSENIKNGKSWNIKHAGKQTGYKHYRNDKCISITLCIDNISYPAHRIAWLIYYGYEPEKEIDHVNMDASDNRILNLREADRSQNECNKPVRSDNKLGIKGVSYDEKRNKYVVQFKFKDIFIRKRVLTLKEAIQLYKSLSIQYHKEFARYSEYSESLKMERV